MDILNKPIDSFTFEDIVNFCQQGQIEGYQIDYKKELPKKGLAKHFAAFSNSRGGVIIIGVEEDTSGKPKTFDGIVFDSKIADKIHQYATSVDPRPLYDLHVTNEVNGKVFILVRIYEGDRTPYYAQNEASIFVRTGNITDPIDLASPEAVELLVGKKDKARLARELSIKRANEVYDAAVESGDKERLRLIAVEKENYQRKVELAKQTNTPKPEYESQYFQKKLGSEVSMMTIVLQPFFPLKSLCSPRDIKNGIEEIRYRHGDAEFPNYNIKPIQDGVLYFNHSYDGSITCHQLFSNGLAYLAEDVLRQNRGDKRIYIETIAVYYFLFLKALKNYYSYLKYQGGIHGYLHLDNINGASIKRLIPNGYRAGLFWNDEKEVPLMNSYEWKIEIETSILMDDNALQNYFIEFIREFYWSIGYEDVSEDLIKAFLKDKRWLVDEPTDSAQE